MKYLIFALSLLLFSCHEEPEARTIDKEKIIGNWRVVEETYKKTNISRYEDSGIIVEWGGSYIGAIKMYEDGTMKINSFDGSYAGNNTDGTWSINGSTDAISFTIRSTSEEFKVRVEDGFLILESQDFIFRHKRIL